MADPFASIAVPMDAEAPAAAADGADPFAGIAEDLQPANDDPNALPDGVVEHDGDIIESTGKTADQKREEDRAEFIRSMLPDDASDPKQIADAKATADAIVGGKFYEDDVIVHGSLPLYRAALKQRESAKGMYRDALKDAGYVTGNIMLPAAMPLVHTANAISGDQDIREGSRGIEEALPDAFPGKANSLVRGMASFAPLIAESSLPGGVFIAAAQMGTQSFDEAKTNGLSDAEAYTRAVATAGTVLALPAGSKALDSVAEAIAAKVGYRVANKVSQITGSGLAGELTHDALKLTTRGAVHGEGANIAFTGANAAAAIPFDGERATEELIGGLSSPDLALMSAIMGPMGIRAYRKAQTQAERAAILDFARKTAEARMIPEHSLDKNGRAEISLTDSESFKPSASPEQVDQRLADTGKSMSKGGYTGDIKPQAKEIIAQEDAFAQELKDAEAAHAEIPAKDAAARAAQEQEAAAAAERDRGRQAANDIVGGALPDAMRRDQEGMAAAHGIVGGALREGMLRDIDAEKAALPDPAAEAAKKTVAEQERVTASKAETERRQQAFLIREDLRLLKHGQPGGHFYDENGKLAYDENLPSEVTKRNLGKQQKFVRDVLGEDHGAFAADDPIARSSYNINEKPLPEAMASGVKRAEPLPAGSAPVRTSDARPAAPAGRGPLEAPEYKEAKPPVTAEDRLADMPPAKRAAALAKYPLSERPAMVRKVMEVVQRRKAEQAKGESRGPQGAEGGPGVAPGPVPGRTRAPAAEVAPEAPAAPPRPAYPWQEAEPAPSRAAKDQRGAASAAGVVKSAQESTPAPARAGSTPTAPPAPGAQAAPGRPIPASDPAARPRQTADSIRQQIEDLPVSKANPGLSDALMSVVNARAKALGVSPDHWVGSRLAGMDSGKRAGAPIQTTETLNQQVSTRVPSSKKPTEDHLAAMLTADLPAAMRDEKFMRKLSDTVLNYVNMPTPRGVGSKSSDVVVGRFIEHTVRNLLTLHDAMAPELRERAKLWYDGARKITDRWSTEYNQPDRAVAGVLASLSPQKDWFMNVSLAKRVLDVVTHQQHFRWDDRMSDIASRILAKPEYAERRERITGKTFSELGDNVLDKAMWLRVYDEAHNDRSFPVVTPEGDFSSPKTTNDGSEYRVAWGGFDTIAKAISILHDPSMKNISENLGGMHKVRNFYNNIYDPKAAGGHVTIDTHAVAAALMRPLSGAAKEVSDNFGSIENAATGIRGTYPLYAEAYKQAAAQRGLLPREMQSITWEAVRGLFSAAFKRNEGNVDAVNSIWKSYKNGEITHEQAIERIFNTAGGITKPDWAEGSRSGGHEGERGSVDAQELPGEGIRGGAESDASRTGSDDTGRDQGSLNQRAISDGMYRDPDANRLKQADSLRDAPGKAAGETETLGKVEFSKIDHRAVVTALEGANKSTVLHELAHVFRRDLSIEEESIAAKWARAAKRRDGTWSWSTGAEERFARAFERWVRDGRAPVPELVPVFQKFKNWLHEVYSAIIGRKEFEGSELTPEIRGVFERMFKEGQKPSERFRDVDSEFKRGEKAGVDAEPLGVENRRPDLAIPSTNAATRKGYVDARNEMETGERQEQEPVKEQARKDVAADPMGIFKELDNANKEDRALTAEQQARAIALMDHLAETSGTESSEFKRISEVYHFSGGRDVARSLAMRRDQLQTPEGRLREARSLSVLPSPRNAIEAAKIRHEIREKTILLQKTTDSAKKAALTRRINGLNERIKKIEAQDKAKSAADRKFYKDRGFDLDVSDPAWTATKESFGQFLAQYRLRNEGFPAVAREVYTGLLHMSGPVLFKKALADIPAIPIYMVRKQLESVVATLKGERRNYVPTAEEAQVLDRAIKASNISPMMDFWTTLRDEKLPSQLTSEDEMFHAPAIGGKAGYAFRTAALLTPIRATDALVKSVISRMEVAARAHESAVDAYGERLTGSDYEAHVINEISNYTSDSWAKAREEAMRLTYTNAAKGSGALNRIKYGTPKSVYGYAGKLLASVILPFYSIPTNIAVRGIRDWAPGVSDMAVIAEHAFKKMKNGDSEFHGETLNREVAQAVMRWSAFGLLGLLANAGIITGDDDELNPHSLNIFGHHFSFKHAGAPARVIGAAADYFASLSKNSEKEAKKAGDKTERLMRAMKGQWMMLGEAPGIRAMADIYNAVSRDDGWLRYAADKLAIAPSAYRQAINANVEDVRARAKDKRESKTERFIDYIKQRYVGNTGKPVRIDGHEVRKEKFDSEVGTFLFRMLSPMPLGNENK